MFLVQDATMIGLGSIFAARYLLSCVPSVAGAAVPEIAAPNFGDIAVRDVNFTSGSGPPPCSLQSAATDDSQIISSNNTTPTDVAHSSLLLGPPPNPMPSPPPCTYIASWALYKQTVKSLATPNYQLRERSGSYVIDASMDATMEHIVIMIRHGDYGPFRILMGFHFDEKEGWCKLTLQRGVWFYVTIVMRQPGVRGVVRLSQVKIDNAGSIKSLGDADRVDVNQ